MMVNATAGTTVLGAFDPIDAIADVCDDHLLWLHVDSAFGALRCWTRPRRTSCRVRSARTRWPGTLTS